MEPIEPDDPRLYVSNLSVPHAHGTTFIFAPVFNTLPVIGVNIVSPALELAMGMHPLYALIELDGDRVRLVHEKDGEFHAERIPV